ncbi:MAG: glycosyltransferase family 39 protein [Chloroflexi bacterium]|nr:glycosyltransferase family 39 protein [Chloroflexota bacterium]
MTPAWHFRLTGWLVSRPHADRLALLALGVLIVAAVSPVGDFPLDDDWWYARPVLRLLTDGSLRFIPGTGPSLVAQVAWGAIFAAVFGFSHTVLRVSTLVLAIVAVLAFHDLVSRALSRCLGLLLAVLLLVNPLFVTTAYSFRTDVPFLAATLLALATAARGLDGPTPRLGWLIAAGILAGLGYLIRQFGIVTAPAILASAVAALGWRGALRPRVSLAVVGPMLLAVGAWQISRPAIVEIAATSELDVFQYLAEHDVPFLTERFLLWFRPTMVYLGLIGLPASVAMVLGSAHMRGRVERGVVIGGLAGWWALLSQWAGDVLQGAYLLPLGLAILAPWPARRTLDVPLRAGLLVVAGVLAAEAIPHLTAARGSVPPLLGYTLSPSGFQTNTMFWREPPPPLVGDTVRAAVSGLGLLGVPLLLAALVRVLGQGAGRSARPTTPAAVATPAGTPRGIDTAALSPAALSPAAVGVLIFGALVLAEVLLLSFYRGVQDRYLLPLTPSLLLLGALAAPRTRLLVPLGVVCALLLGAWSLSWEREYLARQAAIWQAAETLVDRGARPRYVDGGYEWNGWYREDVAVEKGRQRARRRSPSAYLEGFYNELARSDMPWYVDFRPDPSAACPEHVVSVVPYLDGRHVYALKRC